MIYLEHVIGLSERDAARVLRVSIGRGTTKDELCTAAEAIAALCVEG